MERFFSNKIPHITSKARVEVQKCNLLTEKL